MRKLLIAAVAAVLLVGLVASPASAAKPEVVFEEVEETVDFVFPDATAECGFDVFLTETVKIKVTHYFDKDGNFIREELKLRGTSYWSGNGNALPTEHWAWNGRFDEEAQTFTQRGNVYNIHAYGPVLTDSGRITFDENDDIIFQAGNWPQQNDGFGALCDALS